LSAPQPPDLLLDGGRNFPLSASFSLERQVKPSAVSDASGGLIAGQPDFHYLVSPLQP